MYRDSSVQTVARNSYGLTSFRCCCRNRYAKHWGTTEPLQLTKERYHSGCVTLTIPLPPYTKTKSTIFTNTSTVKTPTYSLLRRSREQFIWSNAASARQSHCWAPFKINDWDSAECGTYRTDYYQRITLESWFTNLEQTPLGGVTWEVFKVWRMGKLWRN